MSTTEVRPGVFVADRSSSIFAPDVPRVPKLWPGSTVVILGGGPSLTVSDVGYCQHRAKVIAVKEAYQLAPWADVLYAADSSWWHFYKGCPDFKGLKFGIRGKELAAHDSYMTRFPDVTVLRATADRGLELDPTGLCTGYNSGYQAVNLAVHLGAKLILLLGFDLWSGEDGRANWHKAPRPHRASPYPLFLQAFGSLAEPLKSAGVELVNCSRRTLLQTFPQMPIEEALP